MPSRSISDLIPSMQDLYHKFEKAMAENGMPFASDQGTGFIVTQTLRTAAEQEAYYVQGRRVLEAVNELRKRVGLLPITETENKHTVTQTMNSKHLEGKAFDIAMLKDGKVLWSNYLYDKAGPVGESVGLKWGGRFKDKKGDPRPDRPHFEVA